MNKSVSIITDLDGSKIALINDIRFKSRKGIDWNEVEQYLKEYIGEYFEISETSEKIYIGSDFPDEFSHSNDTKGLKGANMKAKANITPAIGELIQIASEKAQYPFKIFFLTNNTYTYIIGVRKKRSLLPYSYCSCGLLVSFLFLPNHIIDKVFHLHHILQAFLSKKKAERKTKGKNNI